MTKLQLKAIEECKGGITNTRSAIYQIDYRIKQLNEKVGNIRCLNETNRNCPELMELHKMSMELKGDLGDSSLNSSLEWLEAIKE